MAGLPGRARSWRAISTGPAVPLVDDDDLLAGPGSVGADEHPGSEQVGRDGVLCVFDHWDAEVITLKGSSYRLKHTHVDSLPSTRPENKAE